MEPTEETKKQEAASAGEPPSEPASEKPPQPEGAWPTVRFLLLVAAGVLCFRTFIAEATVIPTGSMERTILVGDHLFLNKLLYGPRIPLTQWRLPAVEKIHRGDIVAFRWPVNPSVMFIKRVIAVGGDTLKIKDKTVYINGKKQSEPFAFYRDPRDLPFEDNFPPPETMISTIPAVWGLDPSWAREMPHYIRSGGLYVPRGDLFVMGDNRDNSLDSRFWGFVPIENVVGEPLFVYWSYKAPTRDWEADTWPTRIRFDASILENFFSRTRWSRMGKVF